ncbi:MAG: ornithine cyclodeaminase family protein [Blastocatellia bacterium]|nr:ornithine cyclodeaminase family protein [Blastocatellia bacterium]MCS7157698.1 ornithine cyclodeaminase family protein [Blastocatellia bacterium]MCX7751963.1 ornithine cyclodeaminase family protein [Blastocatellia bacterium]MDW8167069.1 ornithine cyclodeaminase family protein [Acidobacteriota bacterium]MDW8257173.1 ornithine cyclodeaminase family protein [Acidobacteriota bacterium]
MALLLTESDVERLLTMEMALEAVEEAFREQAEGRAINEPRRRLRVPRGTLHLMSAAVLARGVVGFKAYTSFSSGTRFLVFLYDAEEGSLLAIIEANRLGQMRTGAASGVATRYMARPDARTLGIFGTGWQAESQVRAICIVRPIRRVLAYSRRPEQREAFCREMTAKLGIEVIPAERPEEVVAEADVLVTATTAREPVFEGRWVPEGVHINAIGGNSPLRREFDDETIRRARAIVVDSKDQARIECGEFLHAVERGRLTWEAVHELKEVVIGRFVARRHPSDITLFKSLGIALEDVAVAVRIFERAREEGIGQRISLLE